MSRSGRRGFCRALAGLACVGVGGCKIEPILDIESDELSMPPKWPELRPQIPDALETEETTLRMLTEQFLAREFELLTTGALRLRSSEDPSAVEHLVEVMRSFGAVPAGTRGNWKQPVVLDIVELTDEPPRVQLRPDTEAALAVAEAPREQASETPTSDAPASDQQPAEPPPADAPAAESESPPSDAPPPESPPTDAPPPTEAPPSRAIDLAVLGAFRQRGAAQPHVGLSLASIGAYRSPLPGDELTGRVAILRAPNDLDLDDPAAPAYVDSLMSAVRDAGALGCLLLTDDPGPGVEQFRARWRRQVRLPGGAEQAMLIEGLLAAPARKPIEAALRSGTWVLDVDLATRHYEVETNNVLALVSGREHPGQAVVLTASWDTPDPRAAELDTARLLTTLAAFFQLAEWSRRSTPPKYSLVLLLTADAGFAAGTSIHAAWSANFGVEIKAVLALDQPTEDSPEVVLAGRYDPSIAELARRAVAADERELLLADRLLLPSLTPYLRYSAPVMTIGAPPAELVEVQESGEQSELDPLAALFTDVQMLRNLALGLATRR